METKYFTTDTHMGAVHLNVNDLPNSVLFYNEVLGMNIMEETNEYVSLGVSERALIYLYPVDTKRIDSAGLYHLALLVPTREALGNIFQRLIELQYPMAGASDHDVSEAIYMNDPEGNGIEIYRDYPSEEWEYEQNGFIKMGTKQMDFQGVLASNNNKPFNGLHPDTVMGHVHLQAINLQETIDFYEEVFGMDIMTLYGPQAAFMSAAGYHHHLGLNTWNGLQEKPSIDLPGMRKYEIRIPNAEDFEYFQSKLQEKGLKAYKDGNSDIIYDPNGIAIRVMIKQ